MDTYIVNLYAPSGSGKSTGAAYIFSKLKMLGISCELVTEYAKDKVWEDNTTIFKPENQVYIFGKQFYRISRLIGRVKYIITDSPILLSNVYTNSDILEKHFKDTVRDCYFSMNNLDFFINRVKPFDPNGRNQKSKDSSDMYIEKIYEELSKVGSHFATFDGNEDGYNNIIDMVLSHNSSQK